jgi:hypothetical protein
MINHFTRQTRRKEINVEQYELPKFLNNLIDECGYTIEMFDRSNYFGNLILVISKGDKLLRFIRDRGVCMCEIGLKSKPDIWSDFGIRPIGSYGYYHASDDDFFGMVEDVLKR